jgi:membrane protein implicated in regulation of membrane protease activity
VNAFSSLFVWANLPYISVFTIAILFALLQMTGVLGLLIGDSDHDADADADHDVDADADADHDVDADADGDHDADQDADNDADNEDSGSLGGRILVDLGVGRVPFSTVWQAFAITFGISGLAINSLVLAPHGAAAAPITLAYTIPLSLVAAYLITRTATRILGRVLGGEHEEASSLKDLVGSTGTVISSQITDEFGEIRVNDRAGRRMHLICRIRDAEKPIPSGREVVIVDYDAKTGHIFVSPLDVDLSDDKPKKLALNVRISADASPKEAEEPVEVENNDDSAKRLNRN